MARSLKFAQRERLEAMQIYVIKVVVEIGSLNLHKVIVS